MKPQNPKPAKNKTSTSKLWSKKQTTASKLWSKIKSFFSYDIEKDLAEEECTKSFEKIKLFTLTRTNLFVTLLLFLLVVDILVGLDIKIIYLRQILGFLFLVFVPGIVIMLILKIREVGFWEYLVYTVGLSISFIMFAGLAVNWILPWLKITDRPLSLWPILISFNIILLVMGYFAYKKNADLKPLDITHPKLDTINKIFFIAPMIFPPLSILGAFLLNNHGTNLLTMIMLGGIAVYVLLITIFRKKLNENVWPWALWLIGSSLLLSGWMRSWYVSGPDISLEYWVFQLTKEISYWNLSNFRDAYNSMLSLTILPTILSHFIYTNDQFIFKLFTQIYTSIIPIVIYLISRKILNKPLSFLSSLIYLFLPDSLNWYSIPVRQGVAFLFFSILILILFTKTIKIKSKTELFLISGISMVVSHYSTTYIGLIIIILYSLAIYPLYTKLSNKTKSRIFSKKASEIIQLIGVISIILIFIFGVFWYNQVTPISGGLISFTSKSVSNLKNMFNEDTRQAGASDPIFGFFNKPQSMNLIDELRNESKKIEILNGLEG